MASRRRTSFSVAVCRAIRRARIPQLDGGRSSLRDTWRPEPLTATPRAFRATALHTRIRAYIDPARTSCQRATPKGIGMRLAHHAFVADLRIDIEKDEAGKPHARPARRRPRRARHTVTCDQHRADRDGCASAKPPIQTFLRSLCRATQGDSGIAANTASDDQSPIRSTRHRRCQIEFRRVQITARLSRKLAEPSIPPGLQYRDRATLKTNAG